MIHSVKEILSGACAPSTNLTEFRINRNNINPASMLKLNLSRDG